MAPYNIVYSELRRENHLELEYQMGWQEIPKLQKLQTSMKKMWKEKEWETVADYGKYYNSQDVVPFLVGVCNYAKEIRSKSLVVIRDGISCLDLPNKL